MPRSREELLDAGQSYLEGSENRLTEVLATVLAAHDDLAREFFALAGLTTADAERFEVYTQVPVAEGARPDMVVWAFIGDAVVALLWCEHKVGPGAFRDLQLEDYRDALGNQRCKRNRLVGIVSDVTAGHEGPDWTMLTWQSLAEAANNLGRRWGTAVDAKDWRTEALAPLAPARERLLHELLWYLEESENVVVDALVAENVESFRGARKTALAIVTLLGRTAEHASPFKADGEANGTEWGDQYWVQFQTPDDSWLQRLRAEQWYAWPELTLADSAGWSAAHDGDPAFGAGYTLDKRLYETLASDEAWVRRLEAKELSIGEFDGYTRVFRTKPLADLVSAYDTLDMQARTLAAWTRESLQLAADADPGPFDLPSKRRRRPKGSRSEERAASDDQSTRVGEDDTKL